MQESWQASERGEGQLRELNSMIRRQESYFGSAFGLFMVANAVLVLACFQQEDHYLSRTAVALIALALNGYLFLLLMEAREYLSLWKKKALALESDLGVTQEFRIWGETPKSMLKHKMGPMTAAALLVYWGVCFAHSLMNLVM
jgi:hypothetical protein